MVMVTMNGTKQRGNPKGEEDKDLFSIQKNPTLNRFLCVLEYFGPEGSSVVDKDVLKELRLTQSDKYSCHLLLLTQLEEGMFKKIFGNPDREQEFSGFLDLIEIREDNEGISIESYVDIVANLGLVEEWLAMLMSGAGLSDFMPKTAKAIIDKLVERDIEFGKAFLIDFVIDMFRFVRISNESFKEQYFTSFKSLATFVLKSNLLSDVDKWLVIFRMLAIAVLKPSQRYERNPEIMGLLTEWKLDEPLASKQSVKLYEKLFETNYLTWMGEHDDASNVGALKELEDFLQSIHLKDLEAINSEELEGLYRGKKFSSYIGGSAYLISLALLEEKIELKDFPNIAKIIIQWIEQKPKMTSAEFVTESVEFSGFCKMMKMHGEELDAYKYDWIQTFLGYPASEIFGTAEGFELGRKFILGSKANATPEFIIQYLSKLHEYDGELTEAHKQALLKSITLQSRFSNYEQESIIKELFKNGTHNKLCLKTFPTIMNILLSQLSTVEFEKDYLKLQKHRMDILLACCQDPIKALTQLLDQSIKWEHFKALSFASPFFNLGFPTSRSDRANLPDTALINCFEYILTRLPQYPDIIYDSMSTGIKYLIWQEIFNAKDVFEILKHRVLKQLNGKTYPPGVVLGFIVLIERLTFTLMESTTNYQKLFKNIEDFAARLFVFFTKFTNKSAFAQVQSIKDHLNTLMKAMEKSGIAEIPGKLKSLPDLQEILEEKGPYDIGMMYVNNVVLRSDLLKFIEEYKLYEEHNFETFRLYTIQYVCGTCESDWDALVEFLFGVALKSNVAFKKGKFSEITLMNESLLDAYDLLEAIPDAMPNYLKFYDFTCQYLTKNGKIAAGEEKLILKKLLILAFDLSKVINEEKGSGKEKAEHRRNRKSQAASLLYAVLSILLRRVTEYDEQNMLTEQDRKRILRKLRYLPDMGSKCEPLCWLIKNQLVQDSPKNNDES